MVIVDLGFQHRGEGIAACIESYEEFRRQAAIHDYKESNHAIDVFGNTAVAAYRFEIAYEMNGKSFREAGRDVFVLIREEDKRLPVWRTVVSIPGVEKSSES